MFDTLTGSPISLRAGRIKSPLQDRTIPTGFGVIGRMDFARTPEFYLEHPGLGRACRGPPCAPGTGQGEYPASRAAAVTFLPGSEGAGAVAKIDSSDNSEAVKLAVRFTALTAKRLCEVRRAIWDEIDVDARTWTIP